MPLQKQSAIISFSEGLETKTDPRQVVAGKMEALQNSKFTVGSEFSKRDGYTELTSTGTSIGYGIANFNENELIAIDRNNFYGYSSEIGSLVSKGRIENPIEVASNFVNYPSSSAFSGVKPLSTIMDSAVASNGYALYVFNQSYYSVSSINENNVVVAPVQLVNSSSNNNIYGAKTYVLGNYFIVVYVNGANNKLEYIAIPTASPGSPNAAVQINTITGDASGYRAHDEVIISGKLYINYATSTNIGMRTLDSSLTLSSETAVAVTTTPMQISVWADTVPAVPNLWVCYGYSNGTVKYFVRASNNLSSVLAVTNLVTTRGTLYGITGCAPTGLGHTSVIYVEVEQVIPRTVLSNQIYRYTASDTATVGGGSVINQSGHILSRSFQVSNNGTVVYTCFTYGSTNVNAIPYTGADDSEPTNFLMADAAVANSSINNNASPYPVAKFSALNAMPYNLITQYTTVVLTSVSAITSTKFFIAYAKTFALSAPFPAFVQRQFSIAATTFQFDSDNFQSANLGNNLNYCGGVLRCYDGFWPSEQNFHVFPENIAVSTATTGGFVKNGAILYVATYKYNDSKGNVIRSGVSPPFSITTTGSNTSTNTILVPTLQYTEKLNGFVYTELYRTQADGTIYYKLAELPQDIANQAVTFTDKSSDNDLIQGANAWNSSLPEFSVTEYFGEGKLLYINGGEVPNSGGPPCLSAVVFKNRLFVIDAEDRNLLWYSKQTLDATPVEMSADFTFFVDPRFGVIKAISVIDDKLIVFKKTAAFYIYGNGPDSTGANNDFSDATFITSDVGVNDPKSVIRTPDGIIFKSLKGIYMLGRDLSMSYIGAPVEAYNSYTVTGAQLIPETTEVRFTLSNGQALNYDYFYKQWSVYSNYSAISTALFNDIFTYIDSSGNIFKETPGTYNDNGSAIYQGFTTSWLSLAGLQGFQRIYAVYLLTKYFSAHNLTVGIAYDFDDTIVQTITLDATTLAANNGNSVGQWRINIDRQKCQAIKLTITEIADPTAPVNGQGLSLESINILIGTKLSFPKLPAIQEATS